MVLSHLPRSKPVPPSVRLFVEMVWKPILLEFTSADNSDCEARARPKSSRPKFFVYLFLPSSSLKLLPMYCTCVSGHVYNLCRCIETMSDADPPPPVRGGPPVLTTGSRTDPLRQVFSHQALSNEPGDERLVIKSPPPRYAFLCPSSLLSQLPLGSPLMCGRCFP